MPLLVELADEAADAVPREEACAAAGVELAEVDRLADVRVRLAPGLAALADDDAGELVAPAAHRLGGLDEHRGPDLVRAVPPRREVGREPRQRRVGVGLGRVDRDLRDPGLLDRLAEGLALRCAREVAHRLVEEGLAVADARDRGAQVVAAGRFAQRREARIVAGGAVRRGEQLFGSRAVGEARAEPRLVRGVLEQAAHEVRHAGDHLAHRHVLAHAKVHLGAGGLQLVAHAVEHLQLERRAGQAEALDLGERRRDRPGVVRAERELHAALAAAPRRRLEEDAAHPLEARVAVALAAPDRHRPAHLLGVDRLVVPVRALDEAHRHRTAASRRPLGDVPRVVVARAQVRLHGEPALERDRIAASLEELEGEVLERPLLHVEVDEDAALGGGLEHRRERLHESSQRALEVDRIGRGVERGDLDRDVRARDRPKMIRVEPRVRGPLRDRLGQIADEVEVLAAVDLGLGVGDARFAEQVDREGEAALPELLEHRQRVGGVAAGDELARHPLDAARHRLRDEPLRHAAGLEADAEPRRQRDARLREVVLEMVVDLLGGLEHRERVDEPEELDLEGLVLHGPVHQRVGPVRAAQETRTVPCGAVEQLAAEFEDRLLVDGGARGGVGIDASGGSRGSGGLGGAAAEALEDAHVGPGRGGEIAAAPRRGRV